MFRHHQEKTRDAAFLYLGEPQRNTRVLACLEMAKKFAEKRDFAVKCHSAIFSWVLQNQMRSSSQIEVCKAS
jgi:hypothetical protein